MSLTNGGGWVRLKTLGHKSKRKDKKKAGSVIQPSCLAFSLWYQRKEERVWIGINVNLTFMESWEEMEKTRILKVDEIQTWRVSWQEPWQRIGHSSEPFGPGFEASIEASVRSLLLELKTRWRGRQNCPWEEGFMGLKNSFIRRSIRKITAMRKSWGFWVLGMQRSKKNLKIRSFKYAHQW